MIMIKPTHIYLLSLLLTVCIKQAIFSPSSPKIGIIGGGIGGTSCAYFLKQLFSNEASITLFEKDFIGGRLRVMDVDGKEYEAGGSVIHPRNQYMVQFSQLLNLSVTRSQSSSLGIYDGKEFVFEESDWYIVTMLKLIWRYGFSLFRLFRDIRSLLEDFSRIYDVQQSGYSFTTVDKLLDSMNPVFKEMSQSKLSEFLQKQGYSGKLLDEFVQSITMVNYGQANNISAFPGYVSLAAAENYVWSIKGGNKLIPEGLLKLSKAEFVHGSVSEIELLPDNTYTVKYKTTPEGGLEAKKFDQVILSFPLIQGNHNIKFVNFPTDFHQLERPYHKTVTTFVRGNINPLAFKQKTVPRNIFVNNLGLPFNSIAEALPVSGEKTLMDKKVYKIFSQLEFDNDTVENYFTDVDTVMDKVWLAYPHYEPPEKFVPFVLHPGLYYINAIELSASAMEMSAIAAKNIALLVYGGFVDKMDSNTIVSKEEL